MEKVLSGSRSHGDISVVQSFLQNGKKTAKFIHQFDIPHFVKGSIEQITQIATIQKNVRYEAAEQNYLATDNHPVECYRCNIPVQNYDEFLETYGVREGDGMYLAPEDRIRVW